MYLNPVILKKNFINNSYIFFSLKILVKKRFKNQRKINSKNSPLKCSKQIKVIEPTTNFRAGDTEKCEIPVEAFKEIKVGEKKVAFEAESAEENYTYLWTAFYRDGTQKTSTDRKPQFDVTNDHVIDRLELQITLKSCTKKILKSYHSNFWYFF